jgi:hypothetical protein
MFGGIFGGMLGGMLGAMFGAKFAPRLGVPLRIGSMIILPFELGISLYTTLRD